MICPVCGKLNEKDARFCTNCGVFLKGASHFSNAIYCIHCGHANPENAHYCISCGKPIPLKKAGKGKKKKEKAASPAKQRKQNRFATPFTITLAVIFTTFFAFLLLFRSQNTRSDDNWQSTIPISPDQAFWSEQVLQVASQFYCACGNCGPTSLDSCNCDVARQEKNMIRKRLREGAPEKAIVQEIALRFGNRKNIGLQE